MSDRKVICSKVWTKFQRISESSKKKGGGASSTYIYEDNVVNKKKGVCRRDNNIFSTHGLP